MRADNTQEIEEVAERNRPIPRLIPRPSGRTGLEGIVARIGCDEAMVSFAGAQGNLAGLDQVNLLIPRSQIGRGEVDVVLTVDGATTNMVKINIK